VSDYDFSDAFRAMFYAVVVIVLLLLVAAFLVGRCSTRYTVDVKVNQQTKEIAK
jgi:hypothetical protein